jgi:hypothetical protein
VLYGVPLMPQAAGVLAAAAARPVSLVAIGLFVGMGKTKVCATCIGSLVPTGGGGQGEQHAHNALYVHMWVVRRLGDIRYVLACL